MTALFEHPSLEMKNSGLKKALFMWRTNHSLTAYILVHKETIRDDDEPC